MQEFRFFVTNFCIDAAAGPVVFGVTADGATVGVRVVHMPYAMYVEPTFDTAAAGNESKVRQWFDKRIRPALEARGLTSTHFRPAMQLVLRHKLVGHRDGPTWMGKVWYDSPDACRRDAAEVRKRFWCKTYHHDLDPSLAFTATTGVRCFAWATCVNPSEATRRLTSCDVEMVCDVKRLRPAFAETASSPPPPPPPPLRVASFDIETDGLRWDEGHEIRMIGISCEGQDILLTRHAVDTASSSPDYCVVDCGGDEKALIRAFVSTVRELRPVFLTGWNIFGFDLQFVFERAKALGVFPTLQRLSWLPSRPLQPMVKEMSSSAFGQNKIYHDDVQGLITLDGYILARKGMKMASYSLKAFGEWVGSAKGDVTYDDMVRAFTTQDRKLLRLVADYCVQDARLVPRILKRMEEPDKVMAMTRLAAVPPLYTIKRGQSILTYGLIVSEAIDRELVINPPPRAPAGHEASERYQGATVIEPSRGYHRDPVAVLDFESLYPSIMLAYNICVSTLIGVFDEGKGETVPARYAFPAYSVIDVGNGTTAVFRREGGDGVVPAILRTLLARRKAVKRMLPTLAPGSVEYSQANAKQLALKVACNSVYGYFGASTAQLYEKALAAAVTSMGRQSLFKVQEVIRGMCDAGTVPAETHVVYGDSVTGDTPLLLRLSGGAIVLRSIGQLEGPWRRYHGDKQAFVPVAPMDVWQDGGFTPVRRVIRHVTFKPVLRVMTPQGLVDCTPDHSLLRPNGQMVTPLALRLGDTLLRSQCGEFLSSMFGGCCCGEGGRLTTEEAFEMGIYERPVTDELLNAPRDVVAAYWEGYTDGARLTAGSKMQAAALYVLAQRLGLFVQVSCGAGRAGRDVFALAVGGSRDDGTATLTGVIPLPALAQGEFVYDLETESHHFGVGPGSLVVHNTDSVMVKFPSLGPDAATALARRIETECTQAFPPPMRLEFENMFSTYLLENKKRYAGRIHGPSASTPQTVVKGLSTQRRDFPPIIQQGLQGVLDALLDGGEDGTDRALHHVEAVLQRIGTGAVEWDELHITKELNKATYKTPPPHLVVAQKMKRRCPQNPPKPGDRITFVVLHGKGNVSERAEELEFVKTVVGPTKPKPDLAYYADQLCSQCEDLMGLCGQTQAFEALRRRYVTMARLHSENQRKISAFFGAVAPAPGPAPAQPKAPSQSQSQWLEQSVAGKPQQSSLDSWFAKN
jgi:DNA polymerase elongation subunit (family B)